MSLDTKYIIANAQEMAKPIERSLASANETLEEITTAIETGELVGSQELRAALAMTQIGVLVALVHAVNANTSAQTIQALIAARAESGGLQGRLRESRPHAVPNQRGPVPVIQIKPLKNVTQQVAGG